MRAEYYPVAKEIMMYKDGSYVDLKDVLTQKDASVMKYCISPVQNKFKVFWNNDHVSPYLESNSFVKYPLDESEIGVSYANEGGAEDTDFHITINMDNLANPDEYLCVNASQGANEETWNEIEAHSGSGECWTKGEPIVSSPDASHSVNSGIRCRYVQSQ